MSRFARLLKGVIRAVIRRGLGVGPIRRVVEGELRRASKDAVPAPRPLPPFTDRHGTRHVLDPELRDRLKPNWRLMRDPETATAPPSEATLQARVRKATRSVTELGRVLALSAGAAPVGRILEVGCYDGSAAYQLALRPATSVVASDLASYYVVQQPGQPEATALATAQRDLDELRERARAAAGVDSGRVTFVEDDVTTSGLEPESFDLIVSFEVLEHVARPPDAVAAMARLLRPGGLMYHDYNPFFSAIGGHSLVTLDLPWGHARLDAGDVERYLAEIRPDEADQALRFYRDSLNRMTLADLHAAVVGAGLELVAVLPWHQRSLLSDLAPEVLVEVRRTYAGATVEDLLATFVVLVARKPDDPG